MNSALSTSSPAIHLIPPKPSFEIHGVGMRTILEKSRPHTGLIKRRVDGDPDDTIYESYKNLASEGDGSSDGGATFIVDNRSERQTRIKLESLERRMKANEKARKDLDEEVELWKRRTKKAEQSLPEMQTQLDETIRSNEELRAKNFQLENERRDNQQLKSELEEKSAKLEEELKELNYRIASLLITNQADLDTFPKTSEAVIALVTEQHSKSKNLEYNNASLENRLQKAEQQVSQSQDHVVKLLKEMDISKEHQRERSEIGRQELMISKEATSSLECNLHSINSNLAHQLLETDLLKSEIRCLRSKNQELACVTKNNSVLLTAAERERKLFLETISNLLSPQSDHISTSEEDIKQAIRDLLKEVSALRLQTAKAEKIANTADANLLEHAKQYRSALFRARTAEDELTALNEKLTSFEHEIRASEVIRKDLENKVAEIMDAVQKLASLLNVGTGNILDEVTIRVAELVGNEKTYVRLLTENKFNSEAIFRHLPLTKRDLDSKSLEAVRRRLTSNNDNSLPFTRKAAAVLDNINKEILTHATLETIRVADNEKLQFKKRLHEQEKIIRDLSKEKREAERLKSILSSWERKGAAGRKEREEQSEVAQKKAAINKETTKA